MNMITEFPWQRRRVADLQQEHVLVLDSGAEFLLRHWSWNVLSLPPSVRRLQTDAICINCGMWDHFLLDIRMVDRP